MGFLGYNLAQEGAIQPRAAGLKGMENGLTLPVMRHPLLADSAIAAAAAGPEGQPMPAGAFCWHPLYHTL